VKSKILLSILLLMANVQTLAAADASARKFELTKLSDQTALSSSALAGTGKLILFWASWCHSCSGSMLELEKKMAAKSFKEQVVLVTTDEERESALAYFKKKKEAAHLMPQVYVDKGGEWASSLSVSSIPSIALFDKKGALVKKWDGKLNIDEILATAKATLETSK
jgi:thiol-disulfide isomerase/thioredoxin